MNSPEGYSRDLSLPLVLERELNRQILASEKLRAGIQAIVGTVLCIFVAIVGDVVNVAFRIEKLNKELGSKLLISEPVQEATQAAANDEAPASLQLRGRQTPVRVYKLA